MKTITVPAAVLKALAVLAAAKDIRYYLNGLCIEVMADQTRVVVTDGHKAAVMKLPAQDHVSEPFSFIVPREVIDGLKIVKYFSDVIITLPDDKTDPSTLVYASTSVSFQPIDGVFPDYRRVFPAKTSGEMAQFDVDHVSQFVKCADILNGSKRKYRAVGIAHNGNSGALVDIGDDRFIGVLMPSRAQVTTTAPSWVSAPLVAIKQEETA